jgi:hypothetical protein
MDICYTIFVNFRYILCYSQSVCVRIIRNNKIYAVLYGCRYCFMQSLWNTN